MTPEVSAIVVGVPELLAALIAAIRPLLKLVWKVTVLLDGLESSGPTAAVLAITDPSGAPLGWTTRVKAAEAPPAREPSHAETVPPLPTGGALLCQPAAGVHETSVV